MSESRAAELLLIQKLETHPGKVEGRYEARCNLRLTASNGRDPHSSPSSPRVGKLLCALVTRIRNNGAHLNFITQREESTPHTKPAVLRTSDKQPGFYLCLLKPRNTRDWTLKHGNLCLNMSKFAISPTYSCISNLLNVSHL